MYLVAAMSNKKVQTPEKRNIWYTNLTIYHCITNTLDQTAKFICILDAVEKTSGLPLFFQQS